MIVGQELSMCLGKPILITGFSDEEPRYCYPFTLGELDEIQAYLNIIDDKKFENNVNDQVKMQSLLTLFVRAFHLKDGEVKDFMLSAIDTKCYPEIMADIEKISGLMKIDELSKENESKNNSKDTLDWETSFGVVANRLGYTYEDISNMTLPQFNSVMFAIQKDINWQYKIATIGNVTDPSEYLTEEEHPLYSNNKGGTMVNGKRVLTMSDIQKII